MLNKRKAIFLIAMLAVLVIGLIVLFTAKDEPQQEPAPEPTQQTVEVEKEDPADAVIGPWSDIQDISDPSDFAIAPYTAYNFTENGYVTKVVTDDENGFFQYRGTWKIEDAEAGTLHINWNPEESDGELEDQTMTFKAENNVLTLDGVSYYPMPDEELYVSIFF